MYVTRLEIQNIRCFGEEPLIASLEKRGATPAERCAGWHVIAGANNSGKTTILQAIAATLVGQAGMHQLLPLGMRSRWIHTTRLPVDEAQTGRTRVWVQRAEEDSVASGDSAGAVPLEIEWTRAASFRATAPGSLNANFIKYFWYASEYGMQVGGWLLAGYGAKRGSHSSPEFIKSQFFTEHSAPRVSALTTLFLEEAALDQARGWVRDLSEERPELLRDLSAFLSDRLIEGFAGLSHRKGELYVTIGGGERHIDALGDGYKNALLLVLDILFRMYQFFPIRLPEALQRAREARTIDLSGVVLIDEPENHLHPAMQQAIGPWLKAHFPRLQFIVATHSPFICQAAEPEGLYRLAGSRLIRLGEEAWRSVANGTVEDAILSELFGLEDSRSAAAIRLSERLGEIEAIAMGGKRLSAKLRAEYDALQRQLPAPETEGARLLRAMRKRYETTER